MSGLQARRSAAAQVFVEDVERPVVSDDEAHHLVRVLRLGHDETVVASDGRGTWRLCHLEPAPSGGSSDALGLLLPVGALRHEPPPVPPVAVAFAPVKGDRPEWVVQKLTECGVDDIVILETDRSVVHWRGPRRDRALERLRLVARQAAAQSRRVWLPTLSGPARLDVLSARRTDAPLVLAEPGGDAPTLARPSVAVGPEGGWSETELAGRPTVGLGPAVLRSETAAVAAGVLLTALRAGTVGDRMDRTPDRT